MVSIAVVLLCCLYAMTFFAAAGQVVNGGPGMSPLMAETVAAPPGESVNKPVGALGTIAEVGLCLCCCFG